MNIGIKFQARPQASQLSHPRKSKCVHMWCGLMNELTNSSTQSERDATASLLVLDRGWVLHHPLGRR